MTPGYFLTYYVGEGFSSSELTSSHNSEDAIIEYLDGGSVSFSAYCLDIEAGKRLIYEALVEWASETIDEAQGVLKEATTYLGGRS